MAQLKSTNILGNLAVTGEVVASSIKIPGGTGFLKADGSIDTTAHVTGSGLTADKIVLGNGNSTIKTGSKGIATTLTSTDDSNVPTSKAIATYLGSYLTTSSASSTYLSLAGGNLTGPISFTDKENTTGKNKNYLSAGGGYSKTSGKRGLKILALEQSNAYMGMGVDLVNAGYELVVATGRAGDTTASRLTFATSSADATDANVVYKELGGFTASGATTPVVTFDVKGTISENGTALSSKYLGISSKAADSEKLDGVNSTGFSLAPASGLNGSFVLTGPDKSKAGASGGNSLYYNTNTYVTSTGQINAPTFKVNEKVTLEYLADYEALAIKFV